jgi:hypothetical protein
VVGDAAEATAFVRDGDAVPAVVGGTPAGLPVGIEVALLTGGGVAATGAGQTPAGLGGTKESLWPS